MTTPFLIYQEEDGARKQFGVKMSIVVWINSVEPNFESYIFSQPRVHIHLQPLVSNNKGNPNGFVDFQSLLEYIERRNGAPLDKTKKYLWKEFVLKIGITLALIFPYITKGLKYS